MPVRRTPLPLRSYLALATVLLGGVVLSFLSCRAILDNEEEATRVRFERRVDDTVTDIRRRMMDYEQLLRAGAGLFAASDSVSRAEWTAFAASLNLDEEYPGVLGFGYAELLTPSDVERHLTTVRSDGFAHYAIEPAGARQQYAPITYVEPFYGRNARAFGFDMYSEHTRRVAMDRARDTGNAALTGRVVLAQDAGGPERAGSLLYVPVYRRGMPVNSVTARRAALAGWVYCPFRMSDLMPALIGSHVDDMTFELFGGAVQRPDASLFAARTDVAEAIPDYRPTLDQTRAIEVAGTPWSLRFTTLPAFDAGQPPSKATVVLFGGLACTALLAILLVSLVNTRARALTIAEKLSRAFQESEARVRTVIERTAEGILTCDSSGTILSANCAAEDVFGRTAQDLIGQKLRSLAPARLRDGHAERFADFAHAAANGASALRRDMIGVHSSGREIQLRTAMSLMVIDGKQQFILLLSDVSEQRRAEELARSASALNEAILVHSPFSVIATDTAGLITAINPAGVQMLGYRCEELVGRMTPAVLHVAEEVVARASVLSVELGQTIAPGFEVFVARSRGGVPEERDWTYVRKDGTTLPVSLTVTAIKDQAGVVTGFLGVAYDVTERKRTAAHAWRLAHHDALTDLPNRVYLHERASTAFEAARRANTSVGVMLLDLDHFKEINDGLGHHVGDEVLRHVAERLTDSVRPTDMVARLGGDEFVVLLLGIDDDAGAARAAAKVLAALDPEIDAAGHRVRATPSIGIAMYPRDGADLAALLRKADVAMYAAKSSGRNRYASYTDERAPDAPHALAQRH